MEALIEFFENFGEVLEITSFCVCGIIGIIILAVLCLCFHPDREKNYDAMKFFKFSIIDSTDSKGEPTGGEYEGILNTENRSKTEIPERARTEVEK